MPERCHNSATTRDWIPIFLCLRHACFRDVTQFCATNYCHSTESTFLFFYRAYCGLYHVARSGTIVPGAVQFVYHMCTSPSRRVAEPNKISIAFELPKMKFFIICYFKVCYVQVQSNDTQSV